MKTTKKRNLVLLITAVAFIVGMAITAYAEEPAVKIPKASIFMKCPQCALFGITVNEKVEITLAEVLKVHGFCALGGSFSFRAAKEGLKLLYGSELPTRHKIKVQTSHHCCQASALAYITGARGKDLQGKIERTRSALQTHNSPIGISAAIATIFLVLI